MNLGLLHYHSDGSVRTYPPVSRGLGDTIARTLDRLGVYCLMQWMGIGCACSYRQMLVNLHFAYPFSARRWFLR